LIETT
jgi:hypothetical protein